MSDNFCRRDWNLRQCWARDYSLTRQLSYVYFLLSIEKLASYQVPVDGLGDMWLLGIFVLFNNMTALNESPFSAFHISKLRRRTDPHWNIANLPGTYRKWILSPAKLSMVARSPAWRGNPWTPLHSTNLNADLMELIQVLCRHPSLCEFIRTAVLSCQEQTFSTLIYSDLCSYIRHAPFHSDSEPWE